MTSNDAAALEFAHRRAWAAWLDKNHGKSSGIWVRLAKKGSAGQSVTYSEALEVALCFGWIDGQKKGEARPPGFRSSFRGLTEACGPRLIARKR